MSTNRAGPAFLATALALLDHLAIVLGAPGRTDWNADGRDGKMKKRSKKEEKIQSIPSASPKNPPERTNADAVCKWPRLEDGQMPQVKLRTPPPPPPELRGVCVPVKVFWGVGVIRRGKQNMGKGHGHPRTAP